MMTSAVFSGIAFRTVDPGPRGWIDADQARAILEPDSVNQKIIVPFS